ncbi:hypothetical protein L0F63_005082 [Massospora cicadina]|nr:hypothetical protein L0F63_005082 [Massospora cicadina]
MRYLRLHEALQGRERVGLRGDLSLGRGFRGRVRVDLAGFLLRLISVPESVTSIRGDGLGTGGWGWPADEGVPLYAIQFAKARGTVKPRYAFGLRRSV